jgi:hypothetical protein
MREVIEWLHNARLHGPARAWPTASGRAVLGDNLRTE